LTVAARIRAALNARRDLMLETVALRPNSASSLVRTDVFARAIVCSGCACGDCGTGGKRPSYWLSRPPSPAGIVKALPDAGAEDRGGCREDHASIQKFSPSFGAWPGRIASEGTVAELADVPRKRVGPVGDVRLDGDVIGRAARSRRRRRPSLPSRPAPPSRDGQSVALPGGGRLPIGPPRFTARLLVGILPRITRTTTQGSAEVGRCRNLDPTRADGGDSPSFGDGSRTTS
jgi:hypothetical protein